MTVEGLVGLVKEYVDRTTKVSFSFHAKCSFCGEYTYCHELGCIRVKKESQELLSINICRVCLEGVLKRHGLTLDDIWW